MSLCMQVEAQALKGLFHMLLLATLVDSPLHAYAIQQALRRCGGHFRVSDNSVYTGLHRLEHRGLVSSSLSVVNGRTRRTYSITPAGEHQLEADWEKWEEFTEVVRALVGGPRAGNP